MAKIISLIIKFLNIIRILLYKFEYFLLNDSNASPISDAYKRFKVHPLPAVDPEFISIYFQQAKDDYELKHNKQLKPVFRHKGKAYSLIGTVWPYYS